MRRAAFVLLVSVAFLIYIATPPETVHAAFPGTNGQITFGLFNPNIGDTQLWVSNPDGSKQLQLTSAPSENSDWSADGQRIAYDFFDGQTVQIATIKPDGTGFVQLTTAENVFHGEPAWSPGSGTEIAIESDAGNFPAGDGIYLIDSSTGAVLSRVTTNPFKSIDQNPRWSPNGEWIVFTRFKVSAIIPRNFHAPGGVSALFLVHPDGTGLRQLTKWGLSADHPDWSPDGSTIVFVNSEALPIASDLYTIHPDGSGLTLIVNSGVLQRGGALGHPRWSPDGTKIIFDGSFGGGGVVSAQRGLWTVNPDGSDLTAISAFSGIFAFFPAWGTHPLQ
jgi:Tol biopolymer transport system component